MRRFRLYVLCVHLLLLLKACGSSRPADESEQPTSGDETPVDPIEQSAVLGPAELNEPQPEPAEPTPPALPAACSGVRVPESPGAPADPPPSGLARMEELHEIASRPVDAPADLSMDAVNEWARGPFATWTASSAQALAAMRTERDGLSGEAGAMSIGLVADATLRFATNFRETPAATEIAADSALLRVFRGALYEQTEGLFETAAHDAQTCVESATAPWAAHCAALVQYAMQSVAARWTEGPLLITKTAFISNTIPRVYNVRWCR